MRHREGTFRAAGGLELFCRSWHPEKAPRAALAVVHGLGEHSGRYGNVVDHLVPRGFVVHGFDLRGFGRSPGKRGHVDRWSEYRDDTDAFLKKIAVDSPELPRFILGHSMGGLVALDYLLGRPEPLAGAVTSGASLEPSGVAKPYLVAIAKILSRIWPRFSLDIGLDAAGVSRDPEVVRAYVEDPLCHPRATVRWGTESLAAIERIKACADRIATPLFMVHGGQDRLVSPEGTRKFFEAVTFADKELRIYDGGFHEPHNDLGHETYLEDLTRWLEQRL